MYNTLKYMNIITQNANMYADQLKQSTIAA